MAERPKTAVQSAERAVGGKVPCLPSSTDCTEATLPSGKAVACKATIPVFDSWRRLHLQAQHPGQAT